MAIKIIYDIPTDTSTTQVQIFRASSYTGTYKIIDTINATDDGLVKSASNNWIVEYTDPNGSDTNWYKIKFYNGSTYTSYILPTSITFIKTLCTVDEVKQIYNTTGRYTDLEVLDMILAVDDDIYIEMGSPLSTITTDVGETSGVYEDIYYLGEPNIFSVDHVFYGTTTKKELLHNKGFSNDYTNGMIKILPYIATVGATVATGGPVMSQDGSFEIRFTPRVYNRLSVYRVAKQLIDKTDYRNKDGKPSKASEIMTMRLDNIEKLLMNRNGFGLSSQYSGFDETYGVNTKSVSQDFNKNKFITNRTTWQ